MISRRKALKLIGKGIILNSFPGFSFYIRPKKQSIALTEVRKQITMHFDTLRDKKKIYGAYETGVSEDTDLYASCDVAIARHLMGENLTETLSDQHNTAWIKYINSFQQAGDGSYKDRFGHSKLHANGMTIGALGVLNGKQRYKVQLYNAFNTETKVIPWLEQIDWASQWGASHKFWGGIHCYSMSKVCDEDWISVVFDWLNANIDEKTGWWKKDIPHSNRHQPLGGSVHILPIYQHHHKSFPYPERVIDSVLALQLSNGRWLARAKDQDHVMHYLELDALYALKYMGKLAPGYRTDDVTKAINRYADLVYDYWNDPGNHWKAQHPHRILSMVGTFGLLQAHLPERFTDHVQWTDIFSDIKLYNTAEVETI